LLGTGTFASIAFLGQVGDQAQAECGKVRADVQQRLATENDAQVIISLARPEGALSGSGIAGMQQNTEERQERVLGTLTTSDFTTTVRYKVLPGIAGQLTASGATKLDCHADVSAVDLNVQVQASLAHSVPLINADDVHAQGMDGTGVDIAVIDSGIDTDHPDLVDSIIGEECFTEIGMFPSPCPPEPHPAQDGFGHGTYVSGIITSDGVMAPLGEPLIGAAPGANIFALKALDDSGRALSDRIGAVLDHILDPTDTHEHNFDFINMSLGFNEYDPEECAALFADHAITVAIEALRAQGTLTFVSSGNEADKSQISFPACVDTAVSVGAVYDNDLGPKSYTDSFSGELICSDPTTAANQVTCFSNSSGNLDLLAPGAVILASWPFDPFVHFGSGTSAAAPHAAGVAALIKQAFPSATPGEIEEKLKRGLPVRDHLAGRMTYRVDARTAIVDDPAHASEDFDGDGCPNGQELQTAVGSQNSGGLRNPLNPYDYFNPTNDGQNRVDDILEPVGQYFEDDADSTPGLPPYAPDYDWDTDRTGLGPNNWNFGPPNGQQRVDDILAGVNSYFHDCP
jgi:subtilisin family serine protease